MKYVITGILIVSVVLIGLIYLANPNEITNQKSECTKGCKKEMKDIRQELDLNKMGVATLGLSDSGIQKYCEESCMGDKIEN